MPPAIKSLIARVQATRAVRVFMLYSQKNGPILAGGLSLTALYSVFAGIYVAFALLGIAIESNPALKDVVVSAVSDSVPGLIDTGGSSGGAIDLDALFASRILGWSSVIALVLLLSTALNWFASARSAVRFVFDAPQDTTFFLLLKLRDLGSIIVFGIVTVASAAISVFSTSALNFLFGLIGVDDKSLLAISVARVIGLAIVLAIDTAVLATFFRVLVGAHIPTRRLVPGALLGGVGLGILKVLGATIVGGGSSNPLLKSFAVILGLLVWFGLVCQVILIAATWISVDLRDHHQNAFPGKRATDVSPSPARRRFRTRRVAPPPDPASGVGGSR